MLKETIAYTNLISGEEETAELYFHLNKPELVEMSGEVDDLKEIMNSGDNVKMFTKIKDVILRAYGERSSDGKRFIKSPEITKAFEQSEAFSEFMFELASNEEIQIRFFKGLFPEFDAKH